MSLKNVILKQDKSQLKNFMWKKPFILACAQKYVLFNMYGLYYEKLGPLQLE